VARDAAVGKGFGRDDGPRMEKARPESARTVATSCETRAAGCRTAGDGALERASPTDVSPPIAPPDPAAPPRSRAAETLRREAEHEALPEIFVTPACARRGRSLRRRLGSGLGADRRGAGRHRAPRQRAGQRALAVAAGQLRGPRPEHRRGP